VRRWTAAGLLVGVVGVVVLAFFLSIYPIQRYTVPIGWDASEYLWRTRLAQAVGVSRIAEPLPSTAHPKTGRPGYPVVAATLSSVLHVSPFRVTMVMGSVLALAIGLAAGGFVAGVLKRPLWQLGVVALVVSLSPSVIALMKPEGYLDTMLAAAVFLAASIPIALSLESPGAIIPAVALLGAGAVIHWSFFILIGGTLALCALMYLPASWSRWRNGESLFATPSARIGEVAVGGALFGAGVLFGVLGNGIPVNRTDVSEFDKKLRRDVPKYRFPITLSLSALGIASLAVEGRGSGERPRRSRFMLAFLVSWCLVVLAGVVARVLFGLPVAAHRFLSFGLAIPILGIVGVLWLAGLAGRTAKVLGVAVVVVAVAGSVALARQEWFTSTKPFVDPAQLRQAALAGAYLDAAGVPDSAPFVVIIGPQGWNDVGLMGHILRAGLPPERVPHLYVYVGTPESFLAGQPLDTAVSRFYFQAVRPIVGQHPPAVVLRSFNAKPFGTWAQAHPDGVIADALAIVDGPRPAGEVAAAGLGVGPFSWWKLGLIGTASAILLGLVGLGWALAMLRRWLRPAELLAIAPAVGIAVLVVLGIVADRLGIRLIGTGGALVVVVAAAAGGVLATVMARRRGQPPVERTSPERASASGNGSGPATGAASAAGDGAGVPA